VVEKCTFCFHRIDQGIKEGKKIGEEVVRPVWRIVQQRPEALEIWMIQKARYLDGYPQGDG